MATHAARTTAPFPDGLTLADYGENGRWDCDHAYDADMFNAAIRADPDATPEAIFDRSWSDDGYEDWVAQAELEGHPRAREAYERWKSGWRSCALPHIKDNIGAYKLLMLEDHEVWYLFDGDDDIIETFGDVGDAMEHLAHVQAGRLAYGDGTGPHYTVIKVSGSTVVHNLAQERAGVRDRIQPLLKKFMTERAWSAQNKWKRAPRANPARRRFVHNPAWVTRTLAKTFETMEHGIPPKWLPKQDALGSRGATLTSRVDELGCGAYGCALPTLDPTIVLKVTTDETEAEFAEKLSKTLVVPVVTRYEAVMTTAIKHQGRPVTLLWREEAKDIGKLAGKSEDLVADQHAAAQDAYTLVVGGNHGAELNAALDNWTKKLEAMRRSAELEWLARGMLKVFKEQGIGFFDVHGGNIGRCMRDGELRWVISDPGHVAVVRR